MNMKKTVLWVATTFASAAVWASGFNFSVGPAWRSRVKMETRSTSVTPTSNDGSLVYDHDPVRDGWTAGDVSEEPLSVPGSDIQYWGVSGYYTETATTPQGGSETTDSPLGLKMKLGYDVVDFGNVTLGLGLRFAGYWDMRSTFAGSSRRITDWWLLTGGPYPDDDEATRRDFTYSQLRPQDPDCLPDESNREYGEWGGSGVRGRLRADLYQIGIGPTLSWHALSWLDAYASVAALCNIAKLDLDSDSGEHTSRTAARLGFGADVGLAAYLTENIGIYAEVGYEWVDNFDASVDTLTADVDFSSLVVSAGVVFKF